ncbi:MAG: N-carbamoylputrescine amidase [Planctomycetes bacterium]|nr:N-carbamoylputrescine amidase [Planctomycetota bacterium]
MKERKVVLAAVQCSFSDNAEQDVAQVAALVREAAAQGAQVVCTPELFEGHYFCHHQDEAEFARAKPLEGHPVITRFRELARECHVVVPVSFFERDGHCFYNSIALIDATGAVLGLYRKSHIPDGPGYQEKFYFRPGNTGFRAFSSTHGMVGVGICWDQWFPEAARSMAILGAEMLLYPTAIGTEPHNKNLDTSKPWQRVMIGHAVANGLPVVAANRVGRESSQEFYGHSFICDQRGEILAEMDACKTGVITATIDFGEVARWRSAFGFFRDRRPDLYDHLRG